jgi:hypothetical protein
MDEHLPPWLLGLIDWPRYRLFSRCWTCGRLMVLHTPWALFVCERLPMPIEITEAGYALLAEEAAMADLPDTDWQLEDIVPVTARGSA